MRAEGGKDSPHIRESLPTQAENSEWRTLAPLPAPEIPGAPPLGQKTSNGRKIARIAVISMIFGQN